jgi:hypothetical protein
VHRFEVTRVLAALAALLLTVTACDGGSGTDRGQTTAAGPPAATVRTARCLDWNLASAAEQQRLVHGLRVFFGGQVDSPGLRGQVLTDLNAARLLDAYCAQPYASAFSLYRIYGNAAAFTAPKR